MISFTIDTGSMAEEFSLTKRDVDSMLTFCVQEVAGEFARTWERVARRSLTSARNQYLAGIQVVQDGPATVSVILVGELANNIESGIGAYDMKPGFEASSKKHMKKNGGWYLTIPFRHATPGAIGESEVFAGVMPQAVYGLVKKLSADIPIAGGTRSKGLSILDLPSPFDQVSTRAAVSNIPESKVFAAYQHKTPINAGLMKITDEKTNQNSYVTFRRVSDKSDPMAWIHPGIEARHFGELAETQVDVPTVVDRAVDTFLSNMGF